MIGTDTRFGYDAGVWPGISLNDVKNQRIIGFAMRMHNYGFDNTQRDQKYLDEGALYQEIGAMEEGGGYPAAKEAKGVVMDSYKIPLIEKPGGSKIVPTFPWCQPVNPRNMRWSPGFKGVAHRALTYSLAVLGPLVWVIA